jgi:hypothetical protein
VAIAERVRWSALLLRLLFLRCRRRRQPGIDGVAGASHRAPHKEKPSNFYFYRRLKIPKKKRHATSAVAWRSARLLESAIFWFPA